MANRFENQYYIFAALLLAVGDIIALLLFTFFGTMEHQMDSGFREIWNITFPFMLAWVIAGLLLGAYRSKSYATMSKTAGATVKTAILGLPLGLLLRWFLYQKPATWEFGLVAFVFILLFLLLWRWAFSWLIRNI